LVVLARHLVEEVEAAHPGTRIELDVPETCRMSCDPDRMAQVISNLLGNARHHGDASRPIQLRLRCEPRQTTLRVRNYGTPIPSEKLAHIFEPFKRGDAPKPSTKSNGLGLGLFIVKEFVALHGGDVVITSTAEEGTVCTVTLPSAP
jgi:signal transduction histidine kinase